MEYSSIYQEFFSRNLYSWTLFTVAMEDVLYFILMTIDAR